jgi:hypothetical protein
VLVAELALAGDALTQGGLDMSTGVHRAPCWSPQARSAASWSAPVWPITGRARAGQSAPSGTSTRCMSSSAGRREIARQRVVESGNGMRLAATPSRERCRNRGSMQIPKVAFYEPEVDFHEAFKVSAMATALLTPDLVIIDANDEFLDAVGRSLDEWSASTFSGSSLRCRAIRQSLSGRPLRQP